MNSDRIKDTGIYSKDGNNAGIEATMYALEREKGFKEYEKSMFYRVRDWKMSIILS